MIVYCLFNIGLIKGGDNESGLECSLVKYEYDNIGKGSVYCRVIDCDRDAIGKGSVYCRVM